MTKKDETSNKKWEAFDQIIKHTKINGRRVLREPFKSQFEDNPEFKALPEEHKQALREMEEIKLMMDADLRKLERSLLIGRIFATIAGIIAIGMNIYIIWQNPHAYVSWINILLLLIASYSTIMLWHRHPLKRKLQK